MGTICVASTDGELRQGEILSDLVQLRLRLLPNGDVPAADLVFDPIIHSFAVVLSQDCDLDWDFKARTADGTSSRSLSGVLFGEMSQASAIKMSQSLNAKLWGPIQNNKNERYQFLEAVPPEDDSLHLGLPELVIDFKRYFTLPAEEVYARLRKATRRRCRLTTPYAEHLSDRFFFFQNRIALPHDHQSEPEVAKEKT